MKIYLLSLLLLGLSSRMRCLDLLADVECDDDPDGYIVPDPIYCDRFMECDSSGEKEIKTCDLGEKFDFHSASCLPDSAVNCEERTKTWKVDHAANRIHHHGEGHGHHGDGHGHHAGGEHGHHGSHGEEHDHSGSGHHHEEDHEHEASQEHVHDDEEEVDDDDDEEESVLLSVLNGVNSRLSNAIKSRSTTPSPPTTSSASQSTKPIGVSIPFDPLGDIPCDGDDVYVVPDPSHCDRYLSCPGHEIELCDEGFTLDTNSGFCEPRDQVDCGSRDLNMRDNQAELERRLEEKIARLRSSVAATNAATVDSPRTFPSFVPQSGARPPLRGSSSSSFSTDAPVESTSGSLRLQPLRPFTPPSTSSTPAPAQPTESSRSSFLRSPTFETSSVQESSQIRTQSQSFGSTNDSPRIQRLQASSISTDSFRPTPASRFRPFAPSLSEDSSRRSPSFAPQPGSGKPLRASQVSPSLSPLRASLVPSSSSSVELSRSSFERIQPSIQVLSPRAQETVLVADNVKPVNVARESFPIRASSVLSSVDKVSLSSFQCFESPSEYKVGDEEQCDLYAECSQGVKSVLLCPDGFAFSLEKSQCDYLVKVDCSARSKLQTPKSTALCPRENGYFALPAEQSCTMYVDCRNGVGHVRSCSAGAVFDEVAGCVHPDETSRPGCSASERYNFECPSFGLNQRFGDHDRLAHPTDCSLFYACLRNGAPRLLSCQAPTVFNPETGFCEHHSQVPGCVGFYPDPEPAVEREALAQQIREEILKEFNLSKQ